MMIFAKWEIKMFCVARKCKSHLASAGALYVIIRSLHRATPGSHIELSAGQLKHPILLGFHLINRNIESTIMLACLRTIAVGNVRSQLWIIRLLCLWGCQGGTVLIALLSLPPSHLAVPWKSRFRVWRYVEIWRIFRHPFLWAICLKFALPWGQESRVRQP